MESGFSGQRGLRPPPLSSYLFYICVHFEFHPGLDQLIEIEARKPQIPKGILAAGLCVRQGPEGARNRVVTICFYSVFKNKTRTSTAASNRVVMLWSPAWVGVAATKYEQWCRANRPFGALFRSKSRSLAKQSQAGGRPILDRPRWSVIRGGAEMGGYARSFRVSERPQPRPFDRSPRRRAVSISIRAVTTWLRSEVR